MTISSKGAEKWPSPRKGRGICDVIPAQTEIQYFEPLQNIRIQAFAGMTTLYESANVRRWMFEAWVQLLSICAI